jgi:ABC-type multidrug transport system ATPase subunit
MLSEPIIKAKGLPRHCGERIAVDHIDFEVGRGAVLGFSGPNGAGKSTTVRVLIRAGFAALFRQRRGTFTG